MIISVVSQKHDDIGSVIDAMLPATKNELIWNEDAEQKDNKKED